MDIKALVLGDRLLMEDGSLADVVARSSDGVSVKVRYVECPFDAALVGTEATRDDYDIMAFVAGPELNSDSTKAVGHMPPPGAAQPAAR